jgi:hypothetical protein
MRDEDVTAKANFIAAYFDDLRQRVDLLPKLHAAGYENEALLLCCCYIEGLGSSLYWPKEASAHNFVRILEEYGSEEFLWHIHPRQLLDALQAKAKSLYARIGDKLGALFATDENALRTKEEIIALVHDRLGLGDEDRRRLTNQLWRGTLANLVYSDIRSLLVHRLGARPVLLTQTTLHGLPIPVLNFTLLYPQLTEILEKVRELSVTTNSWFGHDFRISEDKGS